MDHVDGPAGPHPGRRLASFIVAAFALVLHPVASAQVRPDAGTTLETVKPLAPPAQPPAEIDVRAPVRPALKPVPGLKLVVKAYRISGATAIPASELQALLAPWTGRELSFEELSQAAAAITVHYRARGYPLAQAYLPAQDIHAGIVEIAVLEGRLGEIRINRQPGLRLDPGVAERYLAAVRPGDVIREDNLLRALLLLNDLPGVRVRSTLQPGAAVGTADLVLDVASEDRPVSAALEFDNHGSRFTGQYRFGATLRADNLVGYGDLALARGVFSDSGDLKVGQMSYTLPVGYSGLQLGAGFSKLDYALGKDFAPLNGHGEAEVASLRVDYPLVRTRQRNLYGHLAYERKALEDRLDAVAFRSDKRSDGLRLGLSGDAADALGAGGHTTIGLNYLSGDLELRTPAVAAADAGPGGRRTQGSYRKLIYEFVRTQWLTPSLSAYAAVSGQLASQNLDSSEKFALGGPYGVRAYPVNEATADEGALLNAELRYQLGNWGRATPLVFGFVDAGTAKINRNPLPTDVTNRRDLWGYGVGASISRSRDYSARIALAWRGNDKLPTADADRRPRLWLRVAKEL